LFVAVVPPDEVLDRLGARPRPEVEGLRWTTRDQWHVTLRFLGQVDDVDEVTSVLRSAAFAPREARFGPVARFGRRVLHVPVAGLDDLGAAVVARTAALGEPPDDRPFRGHITLARARSRRGVDLRKLTGEPIVASWPVAEIVLVESHLHPEGARYENVVKVPTMEP
jgi:2'-5' RNA ligase